MTETEIRNQLVAHLSGLPEGLDAAFITEMFLDSFSRRADLVMANGKLAAFEIKSPRDNLDRLNGQLETYTRYFELVTVVCAEKHVDGVIAAAPANVGVWKVSADGRVRVLRHAKYQNILSKPAWLSFLPVSEVRAFLRKERIKVSGGRSALVAAAEAVPLEAIRDHVLVYMKQRREQRVAEIIRKRTEKRPAAAPTTQDQAARVERFIEQQAVVTAGASIRAIPRTVSR